MRSPLRLALLSAATFAACGAQPLTTNLTGSGGDFRGSGGTGGSGAGGRPFPGTGGAGGSIAECNALSAEYQSALTGAETCQVGASGQCQQVAASNLTGCNCPVYVTDSSALAAVQNAWSALGCASAIPEPPCAIDCALPTNSTCVSADGGSVGFCSYVPGTGGVSGTGGSGAGGAGGSPSNISCSTLAAEYAAVLPGAMTCTAGASGQCAQQVLSALSTCPACTTYVTDRTVLDAIRTQWDANACSAGPPVPCPKIACATPTNTVCSPSDAGGSFCGPAPTPTF
jgi:hypothetical protein